MEITLIIKSFMGLVIVLAALMFLLFYSPNSKSKKAEKKLSKTVPDTKKLKTDLDSLRAIIKNKKTTSVELKEALDLVLKYYGNIHKKLGIRVHPDFDIYMEILIVICRHPNTNKNIIIDFDKELLKLNPQYKAEINDAITKGLNSRGI
ncbi:MAG: hypothetical protein J7J96_01585 [Sulfurimonas sp.]|nr:hypothetical protein [Sulfurimonas sp.]